MADRELRIRVTGKDDTGNLFGSMKRKLEELREATGRRSTFNDFGEILKGGGAVIGITAATQAIKGLAEGAEKVKLDFYDSDKNAADMVQDLMGSVPVLSNIEQAGAAINELFTGQQEALTKAREESELLSSTMEIHKELIKEGSEYYRDIEETIRRIRAHTAEIGMPSFEKQQAETADEGSDKDSAASKAAKAKATELWVKADPAIKQLDDQIKKQRDRIAQGFMVAQTSIDPDMPGAMVEDKAAATAANNELANLQNQKRLLEHNRNKQINDVKSVAADQQKAVDADTQKQIQQQQMEHDRDLKEQARQVAIDHQSDIATHAAAELQLQGKFLDANIAQIHAAAEKEIAEQRLAADQKEHDLKQGSKEWLAIESDVAQKAGDIQQQARDKEAQARKADAQWEIDQAREHGEKLTDQRDEMRGKILGSMGLTYAAEREQLENSHKQRLATIADNAKKEIQAHAEHRAQILQRAKEDAAQENIGFEAATLMDKMNALKSVGSINMNAGAVGGVGLDASAMTGIGAPLAAKEQGELAMAGAMQNLRGAIEKMYELLNKPIKIKVPQI